MKSDIDRLDERLGHIEGTLPELIAGVAELRGSFASMQTTLTGINDSLAGLNRSTDKSSLLQKLLMGSIVVQSLLHGITTPDAAKAAINQIFTGGH